MVACLLTLMDGVVEQAKVSFLELLIDAAISHCTPCSVLLSLSCFAILCFGLYDTLCLSFVYCMRVWCVCVRACCVALSFRWWLLALQTDLMPSILHCVVQVFSSFFAIK